MFEQFENTNSGSSSFRTHSELSDVIFAIVSGHKNDDPATHNVQKIPVQSFRIAQMGIKKIPHAQKYLNLIIDDTSKMILHIAVHSCFFLSILFKSCLFVSLLVNSCQ
jgi:hypothetical protein